MSNSNGATLLPKHIYLLTHARTCSNLLTKILSIPAQPSISPHHSNGYFFLPIGSNMSLAAIRERDPRTWIPEEREHIRTCWMEGAKELSAYVKDAEEKGERCWVKEHGYFLPGEGGIGSVLAQRGQRSDEQEDENEKWTAPMPGFEPGRTSQNPTFLPDAFLKIWTPVFLIRHPALTFPSQWSALKDTEYLYPQGEEGKMGDCFELWYSFTWLRRLYDFYQTQTSSNSTPIVIDADDIIASPSVIAQLCSLTGLDPEKLQYEWTPWSEEQKAKLAGPGHLRFLSTIAGSKGILREKMTPLEGIDVAREAEKWKLDFGEREAGVLERVVRNGMADYEFLRERRLRA